MRDLPVDNVSRVEVGESRYDLCRVEPDVVERKPAGRPEVVEELSPGHVGEEEVEVTSVYTGPQQRDQERVPDTLNIFRSVSFGFLSVKIPVEFSSRSSRARPASS